MTRAEVIAAVHRVEAAQQAVRAAEADLIAAETALDRLLAGEPLIVVNDDTRAVALASTIADMDLSVRAENALTNAGILTVRELVTRTPGEILRVKNCGRKVLGEVFAWLTARGLSLQPAPDGWTGGPT